MLFGNINKPKFKCHPLRIYIHIIMENFIVFICLNWMIEVEECNCVKLAINGSIDFKFTKQNKKKQKKNQVTKVKKKRSVGLPLRWVACWDMPLTATVEKQTYKKIIVQFEKAQVVFFIIPIVCCLNDLLMVHKNKWKKNRKKRFSFVLNDSEVARKSWTNFMFGAFVI